MKTAAQHLEEVRIYGRRLSEFLLPDQVKFLETTLKAYALAAIEEDRKDCAENTDPAKFFEGDTKAASVASILNRPYPELK